MQRIFDEDIKAFEPRKAWKKKVSFVDEAGSSDSNKEPVIGLAEWVKTKSQCLVLLARKNQKSLLLILPMPIGYLISCFRNDN